jgi:DNA-binding transcriptional MerR regulator
VENGHTVLSKATNGTEQPIPKGWLKASVLVRECGGSLRTIQRWGSDGRISSVKDPTGARYYNPEEYVAELDKEDTERDDSQKTGIVLNGSNELLKQAHHHLEKLMGPAHEATREVLECLRKENGELRALNSKLIETHLENVKARESMLSEHHQRELTTRMFESHEARKRAAFDALKAPAGLLLARLVGGGAVGVVPSDTMPAPSGALVAARDLLASLTDDQLSMLLGADMVKQALTAFLETELLDEHQKDLVRQVLL